MQKVTGILFFLISIFVVKAQELPPIQNYGSAYYEAGSQNWSITQTEDKYIYFGNNNGLLEFNGANWELYPSINGTIIRAVHAVDKIIYSGCYMEFGFWERNKFGTLEYTSLINKLTQPLIEDEHFWNITSRDEWVLFQSLDRIYLYNTSDGSIEIIDFNTSRAKIFDLEGKIYIQEESGGLYSIRNGKAELVSEHQVFKNNFIVGIYSHGKKLLVITENGKFYYLNDDDVTEWKIEGLESLKDITLYSSLQLKDGGIILGDISDGYIHVNAEGELVQRINQEKGLLNNTVLSIFQDVDGNLWFGLDNGISVVNLGSAFTEFRDAKGKLGTVYASIVHKEHLYLGTNQGLFFRKLNSVDDFQLVKHTKGQVWNLQIIDNTLFCAHTKGTFVIDKQQAEHIYDASGTWSIVSVSGGGNDLLLQGNYDGMSMLTKDKGRWKYRNEIEGFDISSKSLAFLNDNEIVINHEFRGIYKVEIDKDFRRVIKAQSIAPSGFDSNISTYDGMVLYSSSQGVFNINRNDFKLEAEDLLTGIFYEEGDAVSGRLVMEEGAGKIWGFSEKNVICMMADQFDGAPKVVKVPIPSFFNRNQGLTGFENLSNLSSERFLIGASNGYNILNLEKIKDGNYIIRFSSIEKRYLNDGDEKVSLVNSRVLKYPEDNLRFSFSVPEYDKYTEVSFQYRLKGLNDEWSEPFPEPYTSVERLSHGSYVFEVRARVGNKISDNIASYEFVVEKPWFLSYYSIALYLVSFFLFMGGVHQLYLRYYRRQRNKLIESNRVRLELSKLEGQQEIMSLKNKQLTTDLESKNRELATTAMSLINKNELLLGIKKDLLRLDDEVRREHVIKVIDRNLNDTKDWDFFKEAFNNADKDFLHKIKSLHPDLTANDLKFCAFLRLNLSSKEIAPLLNISVRSVEIKRYRLRKKMNLDHSIGLIDYILEI